MWPKKWVHFCWSIFSLDSGSRGTGEQQQVPKLTPGKIVGQKTHTQ